ncbi:hypothetical protein [Leekyejoonella antrihumi]|uniref:Uncharacterized protein n=1 Tax=Leekyejoonella antrihumi TaxID=1660198 RepID=A0A563E3H1_9MICO|nr:hypothetical protein [Leekyejoonella antrihumi]TWP36793.1 hypothetical protein FGL98_08515 [Leekyejoonella antrihumi]
MNMASLLDQLPPGLAVALRLRNAGYPDAVIATALGIPGESVASTLEVADAKLSNLVSQTHSPSSSR